MPGGGAEPSCALLCGVWGAMFCVDSTLCVASKLQLSTCCTHSDISAFFSPLLLLVQGLVDNMHSASNTRAQCVPEGHRHLHTKTSRTSTPTGSTETRPVNDAEDGSTRVRRAQVCPGPVHLKTSPCHSCQQPTHRTGRMAY